MHYMEYRVPSALEQIQRVLAIPRRRRTRDLSGTSLPKKCNRFWIALTQLSGTASVIGQCFIFASLAGFVFQNWWASESKTWCFSHRPAF